MGIVAEILVGDVEEARHQHQKREPLNHPARLPEEHHGSDQNEAAAHVERLGDDAGETCARRLALSGRRDGEQILQIGKPELEPGESRHRRRDDQPGDHGGQDRRAVPSRQKRDKDARRQGDEIGDLQQDEGRETKPEQRPVEPRPPRPEGFDHRDRDDHVGDGPGPAVVVHRDRDRVLRLAMHEREAEEHHERAIGIGPDPGQAALGDVERGQEETERDEYLRIEDRVAQPEARLDEDGDGRDGKNPDRRHEIEMRPLPVGHAQHEVGKVHRIALVLAEIERPFQERGASEGDHGKGHDRRDEACPGSAHLSLNA